METRATMLKSIGLALAGAAVFGNATASDAAAVDMYMRLPLALKPVTPSTELKIFVLVGKGGAASALAYRSSDSASISKAMSLYKVTPATLFTQGGVTHIGLGGLSSGKSLAVNVSSEVSALNFASAGRMAGPVTLGP